MKLISLAQLGGLKKLFAVAGLGATGASVVYKQQSSHEEEEEQRVGAAETVLLHRDGESNKEDIPPVLEGVQVAAHNIGTLARSVKAAWEHRHEKHSSSSADSFYLNTIESAVASVLAELAPESDQDSLESTALRSRLSDSWVLRKMLSAAASSPKDSALRQDVARILCTVLHHPDSAAALLSHSKAPMHVLEIASGSTDVLNAVLEALDILGDTRSLSNNLAAPSPADLAHAVLAACKLQQTDSQRLVSLRMLRVWATDSVATCKRIGDLGAGQRLGEVSGSCIASEEVLARSEIAQLMASLAQLTPSTSLRALRMESWLYPLICFAADAAGDGKWKLATEALQGFSACVHRGIEVPEQLMKRSVMPLLRRLADSHAVPAEQRGAVRAAVASTVRALADGSGAILPAEERMAWGEVLLNWITEDSSSIARSACVSTVSSLAQPPGVSGLQIAHMWLAEMINYLSKQVEKSQAEAARAAALEKSRQKKKASASADGTASMTWYNSFWKPSYWKGEGSAAEGSQALAMAPQHAAAAVIDVSSSLAHNQSTAPASSTSAEVQMQELEVEAEEPATAEPAVVQEAAAILGPELQKYDSTNNTWSAWLSPSAWSVSLPWGSSTSTSTTDTGNSTADVLSNHQSSTSTATAESDTATTHVTRSDSELALYINAAPVGPAYARAVGQELLEASGRVGHYTEPPAHVEDALSPAAVVAYSAVAAAVDVEVADRALTQALKVLNAMAAGDESRREWLVSAGLLKLLRRLAMERGSDEIEAIYTAAAEAEKSAQKEKDNSAAKKKRAVPTADINVIKDAAAALATWEKESGAEMEFSTPLLHLRQALRLVALVSVDVSGAAAVASESGWLPWLQRLVTSDDCKVASCAAKALLNVESAAALVGDSPPPHLTSKDDSFFTTAQQAADALIKNKDFSIETAIAAMRRLRRQLEPLLNPFYRHSPLHFPPDQRLILHDGIQLFDPGAPHHEVLARNGTGTEDLGAPLLDVVFVHGIRGGAFVTWRREGVLVRGAARDSIDKDACWPASWLVPALGRRVRLISAEYAAPASAWEGESLPFEHTAEQVAAKLSAAGVGRRPVVFVTHSMGGLVVKEILARGRDLQNQGTEAQKRVQSAVSGVVFYSVPHAGSRLADWGWTLRYVGASPAKAVVQLTTGPHLDALNAVVRNLSRAGLPVLSFSEGLPTQVSYVKAHIVPHESAYPGYGEFVVLKDHDHISVCKPKDKDDPAFAVLLNFLKERVAEAERQETEKYANYNDRAESVGNMAP